MAPGRQRLLRLALGAICLVLLLPISASGYISTGPNSDKSWSWQNPLPQGNDLLGESFVDANTGYVVGYSGTVLKTTNGGSSWQSLDATTTKRLTGASFVDANNGWVVGYSAVIRHTKDGGQTWTSEILGGGNNIQAVNAWDSNDAVAVGDKGAATSTIWYTRNGGQQWRASTTTQTAFLTGVAMTDANTAWAVGAAGLILKSSDGGASWAVQTSPVALGLNAITFVRGTSIGYAVGNASATQMTVLRTVDNGATWTLLGTAPSGTSSLLGVSAISDGTLGGTTVIVSGQSGAIFKSTDGGATWTNQSQTRLSSYSIHAIQLLSASTGKAVGDVGTQLFTQDGGATWTSPMPSSLSNLAATWFNDANNGWTVGSAGAIMRTTDAGNTWTATTWGSGTWRSVTFASAGSGWVVGDSGQILHATDGANWTSQNTTTTQQLNGVWFSGTSNGWIAGNAGTLLKTTDGGTTWTARTVPTSQNLNAVWFADASTGYAAGSNGVILRSTDAGATWTALTSGTTQALWCIRGVSGTTNVWAAGNGGTVVRTSNGTSWTSLSAGTGTTQPIHTIFFTNASRGWFGSYYGIVKTSADGGTTWTSQNAGLSTSTSDPNIGIYAIQFLDANVGYLVGDGGTVRRTGDGGATWASSEYGTYSQVNGLAFTDASNGWGAAQYGNVYHTSDGGQTWSVQKTGSSVSMFAIQMLDSLHGWVVGGSGQIRKTSDGGSTWAAEVSGTSTAQFNALGMGDSNHLIAGAGGGLIKYTTDGGTAWSTGAIATTQTINAMCMTSASVGFAGTTYDSSVSTTTLFKTVDGGASWSPVALPYVNQIYGIQFVDASNGYASSVAGILLKTTNGGATWSRLDTGLGSTINLMALHFIDAQHGWCVGATGGIERTSDGGATWQIQQSGTVQRSLRAVWFVDANHGWAAGDYGTILRTTDQSAPTTILTATPAVPDGAAGWYTSAPSVSLVASGSANTWYSWISAAGPWTQYSGPFVAPEGVKTLNYYSVSAGNIAESPKQQAFKVDLTAPTAPVGVMTGVPTTSTVTVSWGASLDAVSGVDHYDVLANNVVVASTSSTSAAVSNLVPNTTYAISVRAVDVAGLLSTASLPVFVTTKDLDRAPLVTSLSLLPSVPDGSNGWYVTTPTVTLSSVPATEPAITLYSIDSTTGPWTIYAAPFAAPVGAHTISYNSTDVAGVRFAEAVKTTALMVDPAGVSAVSSITAMATSFDSAHIAWAAVAPPVSGLDHYVVYEGGLPLGVTSIPEFDVFGLSANTTYSFSVTAVSGAGATSTAAPTATVTTPLAPIPAAPAVVLATAPGGGYVFVDWQPSADAVGDVTYQVWRSDDGVAYSRVATVSGNYSESYTNTGLRSSTRYYYAVSTIDSRGESALSDTSTAAWPYTAPTTGRPERPTGLQHVDGSGSVLLQWLADSDPAATGYVVLRSDRSLGAETTITPTQVGSGPLPSFVDTSVVDGQTYYYSVCAVDASGTIGYPSIEVEAHPHAAFDGADPHVLDGTGSTACGNCHQVHAAPLGSSNTLFAAGGPNEDTTCLLCHSVDSGRASTDTSSSINDPLKLSSIPMWTTSSTDSSMTCDACHRAVTAESSPTAGLMAVGGAGMSGIGAVNRGDAICYSCHGTGSTLKYGDMTGFEGSSHANVSDPASGSQIKCEACHESHASRNDDLTKFAGYMVCMQCHTAANTDPNEPDIWSKLTLGDQPNSKHPFLAQDQSSGARMSCQNCHNTHATNAQSPLVDPHDPSPQGTWTGNLDGNLKSYCFRCHDGQPLPTAAETEPWADAVLGQNATTTVVDIQSAYAVNVHGAGVASDPTTTSAYLRLDMGYRAGDSLDCSACHDPHGTSNSWALNSSVKAADGSKTLTGLLVYTIPAGSITPTSPVGYDLRFFCSSCHLFDPATHDPMAHTDTTQFGKTDCTRCHRHVSTSGNPSTRL